MGNEYIGEKVSGMRRGIERGEGFTSTAYRTEMFSPLVMQMLAVGEETGRVDEMLEEVANFYEEEVEYDLKNLSSVIEPVLIIAIGVMVLILALGVFLPLWELSTTING
jgi:MSHA biogenesis protein MshG